MMKSNHIQNDKKSIVENPLIILPKISTIVEKQMLIFYVMCRVNSIFDTSK